MSLERSLAEVLAHHMRIGSAMPVPLVLSIVRQVCDNLDYAHNLRDAAGQPLWIVHRDVAPAHIWIADTGIVRLVASATPHGNPGYVSPELVTSGMSDPRGDLFALGVVAHEMLANRPLFAAADPRETVSRVCTLAIDPPSKINPQVPFEIDGIVLMALSRDPAYRWQSAAMMRDGLQAISERFGIEIPAADWVALVALEESPVPAKSLVPAPRVPHAVLLEPPPEPAFTTPAPDGPPVVPEVWIDDTGLETQIHIDPTKLALPEVVTFKKPTVVPPVIVPPSPPVEPSPPATSAVDAMDPALASTYPGLPPDVAAPPISPPSNPAGFELDIPEGTQIGAAPLISFDSKPPQMAMLGEPVRRSAPAPTRPPVIAVSLNQDGDADEDDGTKTKKKILLGIVAGVLVVGSAALVYVLMS